MDEQILPRCWAMNLHRQRCDGNAGHLGSHHASFTDEEAMEALNGVVIPEVRIPHPALSVVPDEPLRLSKSGTPIVAIPPSEPVEERHPNCMSCTHAYHRHSDTGCTGRTQNPDDTVDPCSCVTYVG